MMGCSPYETRTQLIRRLSTGIATDVDPATQARFDEGHRIEALARAWAEENIFDGEFLYPIVGSDGKYSASFDGLIDDYSQGFEHKSLNAELRSSEGDRLPLLYRVQMEQQLMVSGARRILFMASKWEGDELIEERHCWYAPDLELRAKIIAGWAQLEIDKAAYVPTEIVAEAVGRTPETLPALHIVMKGEISASNMDEFKQVALAAIRSVNRDLKTDQDFADSAKARKWCEDIESRVAAAKDHALGQTKTIDDLFRTMDEISAEARDVRLALEKLEKARKESRRGEIVAEGGKALADHIAALNIRLGKPYMPATACDFGGAIKGLRTFDSMQNAVDTALANAKIAASATADKIQANLTTLRELAKDHAFLFADVAQIVLKAPDDLTALVKLRIAEHQDAITAAQATPAPDPVIAQPVQPIEATVRQFPQVRPAPASTATISLGAIKDKLHPIQISADGLRELGFEPAGRERAAVLYHLSDLTLMCAAMKDHLDKVQAKQAA